MEFFPRTGGQDWNWGIWTIDGVPDYVEFFSPAVFGPPEFQAIAMGSVFHNLTGTGRSAAVIRNPVFGRRYVEGGANISVQVGQGIQPVWAGSFAMNNPRGDSLNFAVNGIITTAGDMIGNIAAYGLSVEGNVFGLNSITFQNVNGRLVGSGGGTHPITGTIGSFHIENANAVLVEGGFGADLSVNVAAP